MVETKDKDAVAKIKKFIKGSMDPTKLKTLDEIGTFSNYSEYNK